MHPSAHSDPTPTRELFDDYVLPTYGRFPLCLARGQGQPRVGRGRQGIPRFRRGHRGLLARARAPAPDRGARPAGAHARPHLQSLLHPPAGAAGQADRRAGRAAGAGVFSATAVRRPTRRCTSWRAVSATDAGPADGSRSSRFSIPSMAAPWPASPPPGRKRSAKGSSR